MGAGETSLEQPTRHSGYTWFSGIALPWLAGACVSLVLPAVPSAWVAVPVIIVAILGLSHVRLRFLCAFAAGFAWTAWHAQMALDDRLPSALAGQDFILEGYVASFPSKHVDRQRFDFVPTQAVADVPRRIRLSWYEPGFDLSVGQRLEVYVRLKPPRGSLNPGGIDAERLYLAQGVGALGYLRKAPTLLAPSRLTAAEYVLGLRGRIDARFEAALGASQAVKLLSALTVGSRHRFGDDDWRTLRQTGTTHLVAISGLHVGLIALALGAASKCLLLRLLPYPLAERAQAVAILIALVGAACYAVLAGFGLPVRRALIMVAAGSCAWWLHLRWKPMAYFGIALWIVLVTEPMAPLSAGFWLSFGAVLVLMLSLTNVARRWRWVAAQAAVGIGLAPLMLASFGEVWPTAPLVNLVAIPWFAAVVVPGALLAALLPGFPLESFGSVVEWTWRCLELGAELSAVPLRSAPGPFAWLLAFLGLAAFLAGSGFPSRWLGLLTLLPLTVTSPAKLEPGEFRLLMLDVGQGLAAIVRTRRHTLIFDAGPKFLGSGDAGERIVVPALLAKGWSPSLLVVSHGDTDHVGGAMSLKRRFPDLPVLGGADVLIPGAEPCISGRSWRWDRVLFTLLHPSAQKLPGRNDGSCVIRVDGPGGKLLLTGDIQRLAEARLVARRRADLSADVVTVPHHGSRTSSTRDFVEAVRPRLALVSAAHANRWGFPDSAVVGRWQAAGSRLFDTATRGGIEIEFTLSSTPTVVQVFRERPKRLWRAGAKP